jgi:hypothetical protein
MELDHILKMSHSNINSAFAVRQFLIRNTTPAEELLF